MLPRSFLSASSLTNDQKEIVKVPGPKLNHIPTKRRRSIGGEAVGDQEDTATDSSSESDSDMSNLFGNYSLAYLQNDIGALQNEIQHQQIKQKKHMRKVQALDKTIRKNTKRLGRLTRFLIEQQQQQHRSQQSVLGTSTKNSLVLPKKTTHLKQERPTADEQDAPLFQTAPINSHSRFASPSSPPLSKMKTTTSSPSIISRSSSASSSRNHMVPPMGSRSKEDIHLAYKDTLDILTRKRVTTLKSGFDRKARMLLPNNNENVTNEHMKDLMVSSTLDGEIQFWNTCDKKRIDKLGDGVIFKDAWVEGLCWASPTALTLIPSSKEGAPKTQSVVLLDMKSVDRNSVKGDIQTLIKTPHEKGFDVITSTDLGNHPTALKENISFVTAGVDKTVCLWKLSRENRNESFDEEVHYLDIRHTARMQALCTDKHSKILYSGGADQKFDAFDLEKGTSMYTFIVGSRINSINVNNANPNYTLLGLSKTDQQFGLYDKRCSSANGLRLRFGATEGENMSRYARPDWHSNGHTVVFGSQSGPRLNFWDLRYTGVENGPSYTITLDSSITGNKSNKVLQSIFLPNQNTMATVTASRALIWMDYSFSENCKPTPIYSSI